MHSSNGIFDGAPSLEHLAEWAAGLFAAVRAMGFPYDEAWDAAQETIGLWLAGKAKSRGKWWPYLLRIALNHAIRQRRRAAVETMFEREFREPPDDIASMLDAIDKLPFDRRELFLLHALDGMSMRKVAEACELTPHQVRRRFDLAYKRIRDSMRADGYDPVDKLRKTCAPKRRRKNSV